MIRLENQTLNGKAIKRFDVYFRTIRGLHTSIQEALQDAEEVGFPAEMIRAVPVAIDEDGHFEEIY